MNLQTHISNDLWLSVKSTYEAGNFSHAILDAMHHLSNVLRDKTGVDGDGAALVGQALGGASPRLRINKLQTETEQNEQRGMESILRGLYQAIRNPRSHEQIEDTQETADSIIHFVDYLLKLIEKSEEPFVLAKFISRVFDADFVQSQRYVELLISEIPTNKHFDTLVTVYREKLQGDVYNVGMVVRALIGKLSDEQLAKYLAIVSNELNVVSDEKEIRYNLHLLPPTLWEKVAETARLRVENRIIREIKKGELIAELNNQGALATWARNFFRYFTLNVQVGIQFIEKLNSTNYAVRNYVAKWFFLQLPDVILHPYKIKQCVKIISTGIREGDENFRTVLIDNINLLPENWRKEFIEQLKDLSDEESPAIYLDDGTPFLRSEPERIIFDDDDIPF